MTPLGEFNGVSAGSTGGVKDVSVSWEVLLKDMEGDLVLDLSVEFFLKAIPFPVAVPVVMVPDS